MEAALPAAGHSQPQPPATRDWSELPLDAVASIFAKLGGVEVLMGAGLVCYSWLDAARVPDLWRSLDMGDGVEVVREKCRSAGRKDALLSAMAREAVDRSSGQLEVFVGKGFVSDQLLKYIAASLLYNQGFVEAINRFPLLEELQLSACLMIGGRATYEAVGKACPNLKRFELVVKKPVNRWRFKLVAKKPVNRWTIPDTDGHHHGRIKLDDGEALGIAAMRGLHSLKISNSRLHNETVAAILDGCPDLVSLDLTLCCNVDMDDDAMRAKCAGIKVARHPVKGDGSGPNACLVS